MTTVELTAVDVELNSTEDSPTATFKFKPTKAKISITVRYIVKNRLLFKKKPKFNVNVTDGEFTIIIPKLTEAIEIAVVYPAKNIRLIEYFPKYSESHFKSTTPQLRMMVKWCNQVAVDTSGIDHTPLQEGEDRTFGHQLGPHRASRAMAMVHLAMMEAYNAIKTGDYPPFLENLPQFDNNARTPAAVAQAAHDVLVSLFPSHTTRLNGILEEQLSQMPSDSRRATGVAAGVVAAAGIIINRISDGSNHSEIHIGEGGYETGEGAGVWTMDPISGNTIALGARWGELVRTFVIPDAVTFRCPPPPALNSTAYMMAFDEVKSMGGDVTHTPTVRSEDDTVAGVFWAYDGTPSLCAPPRLYNQVAMTIFKERDLSGPELLRILTLINVAMADSGIASWETKFYYKLWRPVTGIRSSNDGNSSTVGDSEWTPYGAPNSNNVDRTNFTPPFPSYPSGHATFGGTLFEMIRLFLGTDDIKFTFVSDEFNGVTTDNEGHPRPYIPRTYDKLSDAEEENGQSRIYLGIHWSFDKTEGITMGHHVAQYVYNHLYNNSPPV